MRLTVVLVLGLLVTVFSQEYRASSSPPLTVAPTEDSTLGFSVPREMQTEFLSKKRLNLNTDNFTPLFPSLNECTSDDISDLKLPVADIIFILTKDPYPASNACSFLNADNELSLFIKVGSVSNEFLELDINAHWDSQSLGLSQVKTEYLKALCYSDSTDCQVCSSAYANFAKECKKVRKNPGCASFYKGSCVTCEYGYFLSENSCKLCSGSVLNCGACSVDGNICFSCVGGKIPINNSCNSCDAVENCASYNQNCSCRVCIDGWNKFEGECSARCPRYFYSSEITVNFNHEYTHVKLEFSETVFRTTSLCEELIMKESMELLGKNPICKWESDHSLVIELGENYTLKREEIHLNAGRLQKANGMCNYERTMLAPIVGYTETIEPTNKQVIDLVYHQCDIPSKSGYQCITFDQDSNSWNVGGCKLLEVNHNLCTIARYSSALFKIVSYPSVYEDCSEDYLPLYVLFLFLFVCLGLFSVASKFHAQIEEAPVQMLKIYTMDPGLMNTEGLQSPREIIVIDSKIEDPSESQDIVTPEFQPNEEFQFETFTETTLYQTSTPPHRLKVAYSFLEHHLLFGQIYPYNYSLYKRVLLLLLSMVTTFQTIGSLLFLSMPEETEHFLMIGGVAVVFSIAVVYGIELLLWGEKDKEVLGYLNTFILVLGLAIGTFTIVFVTLSACGETSNVWSRLGSVMVLLDLFIFQSVVAAGKTLLLKNN